MSKMVRLEDQGGQMRVVEICGGSSIPETHPSLIWRDDAPREVTEGWLFNGNSFTPPLTLTELPMVTPPFPILARALLALYLEEPMEAELVHKLHALANREEEAQ